MRNKLLLGLLVVSSSAFASNYDAFQSFDRQMSLSYSFDQTTFSNGAQQQTLQQSQSIGLNVERLFDIGIWADINAFMKLSTNSLGNQATGTGQGNSGIPSYPGMPASQDPYLGGVNAKVGYAFPFVNQHLLVTPYGLVGRNSNLAMSTLISNGYTNVTNDYFYTGGLGGRIEYRINNTIELYFDQNMAYNWDQSGPSNGIQPQNMIGYDSVLGAKFNVYKNLQLGASLFYENYQPQASVPPASASINGGINNNGSAISIYQQQYSYGGAISVGLTY